VLNRPAKPFGARRPERSALTREETQQAIAGYREARRRLSVGYALLGVLGVFGAHRFYLDRPSSGALMSATGAVCLILTVAQGGNPAFLLPAVCWMTADAFRLPRWVEEANGALARALARELLGTA
jgi:TM2 domain-containing membrane protein YozV